MKSVELSIVIPCYNEEKRLEPTLSKVLASLSSSLKEPFEMVFVDDGSRDRTRQVLNEIKKKNPEVPIEIIGYPKNHGKGYAVKAGVLHAKGRKVLVMDADFSIDIAGVPKAVEKLDEYDVVVGTKKHSLTQSIEHQKFPRRFLGKGFTVLANLLLGLDYTDITCGFKGFNCAAARDIFGRQRMKGWAYDAETLFLARHLKYKSVEIPVKWLHVKGSKVFPMKDTVRSLKELLTIIVNYYSGKYGKIDRNG